MKDEIRGAPVPRISFSTRIFIKLSSERALRSAIFQGIARRLSYMKSLLTSFSLTLALLATAMPDPGHAARVLRGDDIVRSFSVCAGRFSAIKRTELAPAREADTVFASFEDLLDAVGPPASDRSAEAVSLRSARVQAFSETLRLLQIARYGTDARRARIADATLQRQLDACRQLLP